MPHVPADIWRAMTLLLGDVKLRGVPSQSVRAEQIADALDEKRPAPIPVPAPPLAEVDAQAAQQAIARLEREAAEEKTPRKRTALLERIRREKSLAAEKLGHRQPALWELDAKGEIVAWRGWLGPEVPVRCDRRSTPGDPARGIPPARCIVPLKTCLQRQDSMRAGRQRSRDGKLRDWTLTSHGKRSSGAAVHPECVNCPQGLGYRVRAAYSAAQEWAANSKKGRGVYQPFRKDNKAQRARMREADARAVEERVSTLDAPPTPEPDEVDETAASPVHGRAEDPEGEE